MKDIYIADLKTGQDFMSYFIVKTVAVKVGSNKKAYLDLLLADKTGEISAKKWDIADEEMPGLQRIKEGSVIKVKALVTEWNGMKQLLSLIHIFFRKNHRRGRQLEISGNANFIQSYGYRAL